MFAFRRTGLAWGLGAALSLPLLSSNVLAQSTELNIGSQATARSLVDAVTQNEKELIDREIGGGAAGAGAGTLGASAFATGRLKSSDHDGLKIRDIVLLPGEPPGIKTFAYKSDEASAFANVVVALPGTVLGGNVKFSGFVGHNWLSLDVKSNSVKQLDPNQSGSAKNESILLGGTALWAMQNAYALATVVGAWGETKLIDTVDDCSPPPGGCNTNRYTFDTSSFIGSVTGGHVFALSPSPSGLKLDVRGSIGYTRHNSDRFQNIHGDEFKVTFSTWTGTVSTTVFANLPMANNAVLRPYVQGYVRHEFGYDHKLAFTQFGSGDMSLSAYEQNHTYPGVDAGVTYAIQKLTIGGSVYFEGSGDETTLGGRIGATWKLN